LPVRSGGRYCPRAPIKFGGTAIGENDALVRKLVCEEMDYFGIELNDELNSDRSKKIREINTASSKSKILVIPTNEELEIAKQAFELVR